MQSVIYDVAVSIDGYIAGPDGDVSKFAWEGPVVDDYQARLSGYACAIMGRKTYEFGYQFGLKPGANPYPHLKTIVFSSTLDVPQGSDIEIVCGPVADTLRHLRQSSPGPIYLCGGGAFAGRMLAAQQIDLLRLKRAPIVYGGGTPLFSGPQVPINPARQETKLYDDGYIYQEIDVTY